MIWTVNCVVVYPKATRSSFTFILDLLIIPKRFDSLRSQFSRSGQIRWTRKNGASRFLILHTFNIENQNNIVAQNENILKHSSSSSCKDLDINEKWKSSVNPNFNKNRFSNYIHFISLNWSKRNKCLSETLLHVVILCM